MKRRFLIVDGSSVFQSMALRSILRVYKNQVRDLEIHKADSEKSALIALETRVHPDIIISSVKLTSQKFNQEFTIYPDTSYNQDKVAHRIEYLLNLKKLYRNL